MDDDDDDDDGGSDDEGFGGGPGRMVQTLDQLRTLAEQEFSDEETEEEEETRTASAAAAVQVAPALENQVANPLQAAPAPPKRKPGITSWLFGGR